MVIEDNPNSPHLFEAMLSTGGFTGTLNYPIWRTPSLSGFNSRAMEIKEVLDTIKPKDFLILDDSDYNFNKTLGVRRFVKTDSEDGLLIKHMRDILSITGSWD